MGGERARRDLTSLEHDLVKLLREDLPPEKVSAVVPRILERVVAWAGQPQ
jgi:hypothetical protein